jgi:hypothetical protein
MLNPSKKETCFPRTGRSLDHDKSIAAINCSTKVVLDL